MILAPALAAFVGEDRMARGDVSKKIWAYIKEHNLQNPDDRRQIIVDEKLGEVFKKRKTLTMFNMNKFLAPMMVRPQDYTAEEPEEDNNSDNEEGDEEMAE